MTKTREEVARDIICESELSEIAHRRWLTHIQQFRQDDAFISVINKTTKAILSSSLFTVELPKEKIEWWEGKEFVSKIYCREDFMTMGYNEALQEVRQCLEKQGIKVKGE